ncbi:MAG: M67 family metallopeptidase [bacterium]
MFIITERQYKIILKQAVACYPQESGGILGGKDNTILGVLPIPNKFLYDRTETFAISDEDLETADNFLKKHKLEYLGVYHSHPKGSPTPSAQDLSHNQKYLFIVGLADPRNPELYAWRVENGKVYSENIRVISDIGVTVIDIQTGKPMISQNISREEMIKLAITIDAWIAGKDPEYEKMGPVKWDASSFSTLA